MASSTKARRKEARKKKTQKVKKSISMVVRVASGGCVGVWRGRSGRGEAEATVELLALLALILKGRCAALCSAAGQWDDGY